MKTRVSLKYFVNDCRLKNVYLKNQNTAIWNSYQRSINEFFVLIYNEKQNLIIFVTLM